MKSCEKNPECIKIPHDNRFKEGEKIECNFREFGKYYPGFIKNAYANKLYDVEFLDGTIDRVTDHLIRPMADCTSEKSTDESTKENDLKLEACWVNYKLTSEHTPCSMCDAVVRLNLCVDQSSSFFYPLFTPINNCSFILLGLTTILVLNVRDWIKKLIIFVEIVGHTETIIFTWQFGSALALRQPNYF